jgi:heavy metal translocating P-type ATPase
VLRSSLAGIERQFRSSVVPSRLPLLTDNSALALLRRGLVALAGGALLLGAAMRFADQSDLATWIWGGATLLVLSALLFEIVTKLEQGSIGLDIIAALAMAGALAVGETLAGIVVALMYSGGQLLEDFAQGRARREMTALLGRVPKSAMRHGHDGLAEVPIETLVPGDRILIRQGEVVPVDGIVGAGSATLDQSALTGESVLVRRQAGADVLSGSTNMGMAFDLVATRPSSESTYAGIVRLVEAAQRARAPMARLADRYALWFLAATILLVGATWLATGDPIRALAVLVVATPCPLILAVPVAIIAGVSRTAKHGVLVKGGKALEALARVRTIVIDKTGTLTEGRARLVAIHSAGGLPPDDILRIAATLELASNHVVATALVAAARGQGLVLGKPTKVTETPGAGLSGFVEGHRATVGGLTYVRTQIGDGAGPRAGIKKLEGAVVVAVAIDGAMAGYLTLADEIRAEVPRALERFRSAGVSRIVLASGDREDVTRAVGSRLNIDEIRSAMTPQDKVATVIEERQRACVMMVGDGVNDAPALAAADVGVALGARGAAASSEVADVVLLVDRLDPLADAITIAQRSRRIALESAVVGIGLSAIAMVVAALGYLPPVQGAVLQEAIDIGVILNGLRALGHRQW